MTMSQTDSISPKSGNVYSNNTMAKYSLLIMLLLPCFFPAEVTSIILLLFFAAFVAYSRFYIKKRLVSLVAPFVLLLLIGLFGAWHYPLNDVIKDVWYVGKVIVAIGAGYVIARYLNSFTSIYRTVIFAAAIAASFHLVEIGSHLMAGASLFDVRDIDGVRGYFVTVIGLAFLLAFPRTYFHNKLSKWNYGLVVLLCTASIIGSLSRTYLVSFMVLIGVMKGWRYLSVKNISQIVVVSSFVMIILLILPSNDTAGRSLMEKFLSSASEVVVSDYDNMRDIQYHWRGYESYRALVAFQQSSLFQQIFGQGMGTKVDLDLYMNLGDTEFRYIPVLHNGYMYLLVKFGLIGLLAYLYFILRLISYGVHKQGSKGQFTDEVYMSRIIAALGWCLLLTTFVIAGPFNKSTMDSAMILIGLISASLNKHRHRHARGIMS